MGKSKKIATILFLACLVFIACQKTPSLALSLGEEISSNLRKPQDSHAKPLVYVIGQDDVLGISVWQNLGIQEEGKDSQQKEYAINNGDVLEISVWQWPDLTKDVIVRPDGKISFPLIGDLEARGRSLTALDDIITQKLTEFIKSPQVSVMVKALALQAGRVGSGAMSFVKVGDLSFENINVRPDGKISFPLVGDVQAEGLTLDALRASLKESISNLVQNSEVFIQVNQFGGNKVIILGEVSDPGIYRTGPINIVEALSLAGGYTKDAVLRNVLVLRGDLNSPQVIKVNLSKAITGRDFSQNIPIEPRDVIYIPKSFISDINYVMTQLIQPLTTSASAPPAIRAVRARAVTPKK